MKKYTFQQLCQKFLDAIPQERLILYALVLGVLPLVFVGAHFFQTKSAVLSLSERLDTAFSDAASQNKKELSNRSTRAQFQNKDQFYLIKQLESLQLQKEEVTSLKKILDSGFHQEEEAIRTRLQFLTSAENSISFAESQEKRMKNFREVELSLTHPVEVSLEDIKTILARVEDVKLEANSADPSRPHLFFSDFRLEKKKIFSGEAFSLTFKVVKREYLS